MSGAVQEKNTERVIRGLKASIHNPRVSPEAKAHAEERLHEMGQTVEPKETGKGTGAGRRRSGRKARPTGETSKTFEEEVVAEQVQEESAGEAKEVETEQPQEHASAERATPDPSPPLDKHEARVLGGYKATLSKKGVSEEAKRRARQVLEEHNAI